MLEQKDYSEIGGRTDQKSNVGYIFSFQKIYLQSLLQATFQAMVRKMFGKQTAVLWRGSCFQKTFIWVSWNGVVHEID